MWMDPYLREGKQTGVPGENHQQSARKSVTHDRAENSPLQLGMEPSPSKIQW